MCKQLALTHITTHLSAPVLFFFANMLLFKDLLISSTSASFLYCALDINPLLLCVYSTYMLRFKSTYMHAMFSSIFGPLHRSYTTFLSELLLDPGFAGPRSASQFPVRARSEDHLSTGPSLM
jgi:hypothetical protein